MIAYELIMEVDKGLGENNPTETRYYLKEEDAKKAYDRLKKRGYEKLVRWSVPSRVYIGEMEFRQQEEHYQYTNNYSITKVEI